MTGQLSHGQFVGLRDGSYGTVVARIGWGWYSVLVCDPDMRPVLRMQRRADITPIATEAAVAA